MICLHSSVRMNVICLIGLQLISLIISECATLLFCCWRFSVESTTSHSLLLLWFRLWVKHGAVPQGFLRRTLFIAFWLVEAAQVIGTPKLSIPLPLTSARQLYTEGTRLELRYSESELGLIQSSSWAGLRRRIVLEWLSTKMRNTSPKPSLKQLEEVFPEGKQGSTSLAGVTTCVLAHMKKKPGLARE